MLVPVEVAQSAPKRTAVPKSDAMERPTQKTHDAKARGREKPRKARTKKSAKSIDPLSRGWRLGAGLGAVVLLVIAVLRASGPSGWAWAILFGLGAILGLVLAAGRRVRWSLPAVLALVTALWALSTLPSLAHGEGPPDLRHTLERDERGVLDLGALVLISAFTASLALHLRDTSRADQRTRARFRAR